MPIPSSSGTASRRLALRFAVVATLIASATARPLACQAGVPPDLLSNPTEAREFARKNLPRGAKPGDILTDQPGYPQSDVAGVYRAALDVIYLDGTTPPRFVVLSDLAEGRGVSCERRAFCPFVPEHESSIDTVTLQNFRRATLTRRRIRRDFKYRLPIKFLGAKGRQELPEIGETLLAGVSIGSRMSENPFWIGFISRYPGAWGFTTLTQPGFNRAHNEAIVQVRHACGTYCSSMELMLLRKTKPGWRVVERMPEISQDTDMGHKDLRFRGVGARKPQREIRARLADDSIQKMALPRAIRGTVINSTTGAGIPLARISIHAGNAPNTPWTQAYSDPSGKYVVENPPVDGIGLMVHCPKNTRRPGDLISVAGADMRPGLDTTINFSIDLGMCDDPNATGLSPRPNR